uniref:Uncharacterized protein n=1 Tax=Setaria italica TaxID=4555 RepID=K4ANH9_SETIT
MATLSRMGMALTLTPSMITYQTWQKDQHTLI